MVTDISYMFSGAMNFTSSLSNWDVSNVTSMRNTFRGATSFNGDISTWNISNVTNMRRAFSRASGFTGNVSAWNVFKVARMDHMFFKAINFNDDISTWNVSNVTNMNNMFSNANSFSTENYDSLLTGWASLRSLQPNLIFGAPSTTYCNGKPGRDKLKSMYNWNITGDRGEDCSGVCVDEEFLSNTKIYPNPTNGKINIESSFEIDKIELYNILGAKIFSVSKTNTLDLKNLKQGIYILKVFSTDRVFAKKVIKQK